MGTTARRFFVRLRPGIAQRTSMLPRRDAEAALHGVGRQCRALPNRSGCRLGACRVHAAGCLLGIDRLAPPMKDRHEQRCAIVFFRHAAETVEPNQFEHGTSHPTVGSRMSCTPQ